MINQDNSELRSKQALQGGKAGPWRSAKQPAALHRVVSYQDAWFTGDDCQGTWALTASGSRSVVERKQTASEWWFTYHYYKSNIKGKICLPTSNSWNGSCSRASHKPARKRRAITSRILNKTAFFNLYVTFTLCVTFDLSINLYSGCKTKNKE